MDQENQMNNMPSSYDKWRWSMYIGIVFLLVANPYTYNLVNYILGRIIPIAVNGCPTAAGFIIHAIVLVLLVRLIMNYKL